MISSLLGPEGRVQSYQLLCNHSSRHLVGSEGGEIFWHTENLRMASLHLLEGFAKQNCFFFPPFNLKVNVSGLSDAQ